MSDMRRSTSKSLLAICKGRLCSFRSKTGQVFKRLRTIPCRSLLLDDIKAQKDTVIPICMTDKIKIIKLYVL